MEKKQTIEEMARIICKPTANKGNCDKCGFKKQCSKFDDATDLYNAGYRKQSGWISVDERLPEESGDYLTYHNGVISALMYSAKHKLFNAADSLSEKYSKKHSITVSHWMPLPEAPKETDDKATIKKDFYTPEEVRSMSPREVRENIEIIRRSMKMWR